MGRKINMKNWEQRICDLQNRITHRNWKINAMDKRIQFSVDEENLYERLIDYNKKDQAMINKLTKLGLG